MSINSNSGLSFGGQQIPGMVLAFRPSSRKLYPYVTHFCGVDGDSRLEGGQGHRMIEVQILLFGNFKNRSDLRDYIDGTLNGDMLATNHDLTYTPAGSPYTDTTFEGFEQADQEKLDVADTVDSGWFCTGTLRFMQLSRGQ